jgi:hypothetical protein
VRRQPGRCRAPPHHAQRQRGPPGQLNRHGRCHRPAGHRPHRSPRGRLFAPHIIHFNGTASHAITIKNAATPRSPTTSPTFTRPQSSAVAGATPASTTNPVCAPTAAWQASSSQGTPSRSDQGSRRRRAHFTEPTDARRRAVQRTGHAHNVTVTHLGFLGATRHWCLQTTEAWPSRIWRREVPERSVKRSRRQEYWGDTPMRPFCRQESEAEHRHGFVDHLTYPRMYLANTTRER